MDTGHKDEWCAGKGQFFLYYQLSPPLARFKPGMWHPCVFQLPLFRFLICYTGLPNTVRQFQILKCLIK